TLPRGVRAFLLPFDLAVLRERFSLEYLQEGATVLLVRGRPAPGQPPVLVVHDALGSRRMEFEINAGGYVTRAGVELPVNGLRVLRRWEVPDRTGRQAEHDLRAENLVLLPRRAGGT